MVKKRIIVAKPKWRVKDRVGKKPRRAGRNPQLLHRIIVVRHSQRVDKVESFGRNWHVKAMQQGRYTQIDVNLPDELPIRQRPIIDYAVDPPLTEHGKFLAKRVSRSLSLAGIRIRSVYISPALRCAQTAQCVVPRLSAKIVPPFHERFWPHRGKSIADAFLTVQQYMAAEFKVDRRYRPPHRQIAIADKELYAQRFGECLDAIIAEEDVKHPNGSILIVGHSSTADACIGHLIDGHRETFDDQGNFVSRHFVREPAYCETTVLERRPNGSWMLVKRSPIVPFSSDGFTTQPQYRR